MGIRQQARSRCTMHNIKKRRTHDQSRFDADILSKTVSKIAGRKTVRENMKLRARRSILIRRVQEAVAPMIEQDVGERQRSRLPVEGTNKSFIRDKVSIGRTNGSSDEIVEGRRGITKGFNKHEGDGIQKGSGEADEPTRKG